MAADAPLRVDGVSKRYQRGLAAYGSLRDTLMRPFARRRPRPSVVTALDDVSLEVAAGELVAVVGPNGAGKSTLLKVVARITPPDAGRVEVRGRLSALIEVGAGFHPELTGRENVLLHGSILGLPRAALRRGLGWIGSFAGVEDAMDTPVKHFSTGMYARLGFAVAVFAEPRVLLVDEVLSVGDATFQARCLDRIAALRRAGTAVLLVSHDHALVVRAADRALALAHGRVAAAGTPAAVLAHEVPPPATRA